MSHGTSSSCRSMTSSPTRMPSPETAAVSPPGAHRAVLGQVRLAVHPEAGPVVRQLAHRREEEDREQRAPPVRGEGRGVSD